MCNAVDLLYNRIISRNRRRGGSHSIYPGTYPIRVGQLSLGRHSKLAHTVSDHQCHFLLYFIFYSISSSLRLFHHLHRHLHLFVFIHLSSSTYRHHSQNFATDMHPVCPRLSSNFLPRWSSLGGAGWRWVILCRPHVIIALHLP